jgi:hypothetical protein
MILVDTSVFICYFKGFENEATAKFDKIISENILFGINNYIYQELLQGSANEKEFNTFLIIRNSASYKQVLPDNLCKH